MTANAPPLRLLFWETTAGCNLECVHCRRLEVRHELAKSDMTTDQARRMIADLADFASCILVFSGGEPLIRPDVFELAALARHKGLITALASNGTMIDRAMARRIAQTGFHRVSVSLDGSDADTHDRFRQLPGSFDQAIAGLRYLHDAGVSTQVNCTIAKHDADQLAAVLRLAETLGAQAMHYFLLVPVGCGQDIADDQMLDATQIEQRLREILELAQNTPLHVKATCAPHYYRITRQDVAAKRKPMPEGRGGGDCGKQPGPRSPTGSASRHSPHTAVHSGARPTTNGKPGPDPQPPSLEAVTRGCLAGTSVCFVSHQGEVFPCGYLPVSAGNVTHQSLAQIWAASDVFAQLRDPDLLTGKCGACEFKRICGGCRARAFYQYGDFLQEEPACEYEPHGPRKGR